MKMSFGERSSLVLLALGLMACGDPAARQLPPFGEVVLSIDTDAPVPDFVGRIRIDIFDETGRWIDYRDVPRPEPSDWPASFGLHTMDESKPTKVLVRIRGYLEGRVRDYLGERFQERTPYVEPASANTLVELCSNLPDLTLGKDLTLRRGARTLTGLILDDLPPDQAECRTQMAGGVVAARLNVREAGDYRIETTRVFPDTADPALIIRTDCRDTRTQVACNDDLSRDEFAPDFRSRLVLHLDPGSYTVMSGAYFPAASDVTLRADLAANWKATPAEEPPSPSWGSMPRLMVKDVDATPKQEPEPHVTIDRLALVTMVPGRQQTASIVLRVACGGQMAKLSAAANNTGPVLSQAETCIDTEGARVPVVALEQTPFVATAPVSEVGTGIRAEPCSQAASPRGPICIPGGSFVFGSPLYAPYPVNTTPERFALMSRFWLDKTEVTVGRWRTVMGKGFQSPDFSPFDNNGPLEPKDPIDAWSHCTFSRTAQAAGEPREDHPLNCVSLTAARAFCRFEGGDLPTEAQWQYAATKAGRPVEIDDFCAGSGVADACLLTVNNPVAVTDPSLAGDTTPLGVRGLGGNLGEWVLDSFYALDAPCWNAASLVDPVCWERNPLSRSIVGTDWTSRSAVWRRDLTSGGVVTEFDFQVDAGIPAVGFRCAYRQEPR
jgi:formylglycine-generating enzyme required for sulfatase activity